MDPSHASYFRKVMVVLIQRKYDSLVKYIQSHGIIDKLVTHIGLYSIMEILIMIGWDDGLGQVNDVEWLYKENLIPKLVAKLTPQYETATDVHMNAARALVDVVVKCPPSTSNLLISHLQSKEVLESIFRHMFSGSLSSLTNSMSIIIVLVQRYANRRVESGDNSNSGSGDSGTASADAGSSSSSSSSSTLEEPFLSLAPHLSKIIALLHQAQPEVAVQFGKSQPFGETRMKVVELTLVLLRSRLLLVDCQLSELRVLALMLESFFLYPWNNMLHGLVESIVRTVLDSDSDVLRQALFVDGELVERFVRAYERSEREAAEKGKYRLGYMGHLLRTSMAIEDVARKSDEVRKQLLGECVEQWNAFVSDQLEKENEKQKVVAPFVGGEEDILDGLQFDIAGMSSTEANPYLGGGEARSNQPQGGSGSGAGPGSQSGGQDEYSFNDNDDDEVERGRERSGGGSTGYDYSHSYTIRDPDVEYDENGNEADDGWRTSTANSSGGFNQQHDDWGSFQPTFNDDNKNNAHAAGKAHKPGHGGGIHFERGGGSQSSGSGHSQSGRQIIQFGAAGERADEDDDGFGSNVSPDDPFRAAEAKASIGDSGTAVAWPLSEFDHQPSSCGCRRCLHQYVPSWLLSDPMGHSPLYPASREIVVYMMSRSTGDEADLDALADEYGDLSELAPPNSVRYGAIPFDKLFSAARADCEAMVRYTGGDVEVGGEIDKAMHLLVDVWKDERARLLISRRASAASDSAGVALKLLVREWNDNETRQLVEERARAGSSVALRLLVEEWHDDRTDDFRSRLSTDRAPLDTDLSDTSERLIVYRYDAHMVGYHPWMGRLLFEHPSLRGEMADTDLHIVNLDMEATSLSVASRGAQPHIIRNCTNMPISVRVHHFDRDRSQSYQRQSKRSFSLNPGQSRDGPIMLWRDDRTQSGPRGPSSILRGQPRTERPMWTSRASQPTRQPLPLPLHQRKSITSYRHTRNWQLSPILLPRSSNGSQSPDDPTE